MLIAIFDLQVGDLTYAKSFYPSQLVAQIAGYHYQRGDDCVFLLEPTKFEAYDKVYFIYDYPELYFNRDWQFLNNAYFGGKYSPVGDTLPLEIKNAIPSFKVYDQFFKYWFDKYPNYPETRMAYFKGAPFVMFRNDKQYKYNYDGDLIILDDLSHIEKPNDLFHECYSDSLRIVTPLKLTHKNIHNWLMFIKKNTHLHRRHLWIHLDYYELLDKDNLYTIIKAFKDSKLGRMVRVKIIFGNENWTTEEWLENIENILEIGSYFRIYLKRRVFIETYGRDSFEFRHVLVNIKRWFGGVDGYLKNSPFDYAIRDTLAKQSILKVIAYLQDAEKYTMNTKNSCLHDVLKLIKQYPDFMFGYYTKSFNMNLIPRGGCDLSEWNANPKATLTFGEEA
jgi:hypothetical protein